MQQWNGLLKREWASMSITFYASVLATTMFTLLIPFTNHLFNWGIDFLEILFGIGIMWMTLSIGIPAVIFLISFLKEMQRPDVWLHSTASIFKIFGSKAVFGAFVGLTNWVITIIVSAIGLIISGYQFGPTFKAIVLLYTLMYLQSLLVLCASIFAAVLYQLIKPVVKGLVAAVLLLLFWISLTLVEKVSASPLYQKISTFGAVKGPSEGVYHFGADFFREIDDIVFYAGGIFLSLLVGILLFAVAVTLFEKKVRL